MATCVAQRSASFDFDTRAALSQHCHRRGLALLILQTLHVVSQASCRGLHTVKSSFPKLCTQWEIVLFSWGRNRAGSAAWNAARRVKEAGAKTEPWDDCDLPRPWAGEAELPSWSQIKSQPRMHGHTLDIMMLERLTRKVCHGEASCSSKGCLSWICGR